MKTILVLIFVFTLLSCFSQTTTPKFILAFGNDFDGDSVSVIINQVQVCKSIKLKSTMISPQNLMIEQNSKVLEVRPHNQDKIIFNKIKSKDSLLQLNISLNNIWYHFNFDLKKGVVLLAEYKYFMVGWSRYKRLIIIQRKHLGMF